MAYINSGGNFSDNPFAKLLAEKQGSATNNQLNLQEKLPEESINLASGVMGTVGNAGKLGQVAKEIVPEVEQAVPSFMDKYRQAIANSKIGNTETPLDAEANMFKQKFKDAPDFFEKYGAQPETQNAPISMAEKIKTQYKNASSPDAPNSDVMDKFNKLNEMLKNK